MKKATKKPVQIEYIQWFTAGDHEQVKNYHDVFEVKLVSEKCKQCGNHFGIHGWIDTLEGGHIVCPRDYIIKGVKGEFYPCKPDVFLMTYDLEDDDFLKETNSTEVILHHIFRTKDHKEKLLFISNLLNTMQIQEGKSFVLIAETGTETMHSYNGNMIKMTKIIGNILKSKGY